MFPSCVGRSHMIIYGPSSMKKWLACMIVGLPTSIHVAFLSTIDAHVREWVVEPVNIEDYCLVARQFMGQSTVEISIPSLASKTISSLHLSMTRVEGSRRRCRQVDLA